MANQINDLIPFLANLPEEALEAMWLGALLTERLGEKPYSTHARHLISALETIHAKTVDMESVQSATDLVVKNSKTVTHGLDLNALKKALINELKLKLVYVDGKRSSTTRIILPLDVEDYGPNGAVLAFCEKRQDFRHFRFDRIQSLTIVNERFDTPRSVLFAFFQALEVDEWR